MNTEADITVMAEAISFKMSFFLIQFPPYIVILIVY